MAPGARGNPSCAKASNPYHECTQACLQPNKTTPKSLANNKNSRYKTTKAGGYGPRVSDDNEDKRRGGGGGKQGGGCPKASNPYHNCDDHNNNNNNNCNYKTLSASSTPPLKNESKRQQKAAAVEEEEEVEASADDAALDTSQSQSQSRIIAVGGYNVKESYGGILRSILHKYGDIGATSKLESLETRSYYIECVCSVVKELQLSSSSSSGVKLKELSALLKDVELAGVRVDWLRSVLHELLLAADDSIIINEAESESLREEQHSKLRN